MQQYDETDEMLISDTALFPRYLQTESVKKEIETYTQTLLQVGVDKDRIKNALTLYLPHLIPSGTKGYVRGKRLEELAQHAIEEFKLDDSYTVLFEKDLQKLKRKKKWTLTHECPDFCIKKDGKMLIGMVQVDLWTGGAQKNRAPKYVYHKQTPNVKIVSVICAKPPSLHDSDTADLLHYGMVNKTLCYIKGLRDVMDDFFKEE